MNHLFISYSRKDADAVTPFIEHLRQNGIDIWMDISGAGTGIPFSTKWFDVIEEAMYNAGGAIVLHSSNWDASVPCQKEYELIKKCCLPYLQFEIVEVSDTDAVLTKVQRFVQEEVHTDRNNLRAQLFSSAFALRSGVDPYQLIPQAGRHQLDELRQLANIVVTLHIKTLNPEIYPYMNRFIQFMRNRILRRIIGTAGIIVIMISCILMLLAVPASLKTASEQNSATFAGQAIAGDVTELSKVDPLSAISQIEKAPDRAITSTSYYSLFLAGVKLMDTNLPSLVCTPKDSFYADILSEPTNRDSPLYNADPSANNGTLIITDKNTGMQWSVCVPQSPEVFAWTDDGERLIFSAGTNAYIYDAFGKGGLIRLSGIQIPIRYVKFVTINDELFACAITERDFAVLWRLTLPERMVHRHGIDYGVFTQGKNPEVVYIDGDDIIIRREMAERILSPDVRGKIDAKNFDVTADGSRIAMICNGNDDCHIVCVSLKDGSILADVVPDYTPNAVAFQSDGSTIFAAAGQCAILKVDIASGRIAYGEYNDRTYYNLQAYGNNWVLTDAFGIATLFDSSLNIVKELGCLTDIGVPIFNLDIDSEKGEIYTVNRGGASIEGCIKTKIISGEKWELVIPHIEKTDSNTAVAISPDGRFVAFGYANGTVRVYDSDQLTLLFEHNGIGESISALRFSDDDSMVYMLGSSGNLYYGKFPDYVVSYNPESKQSWEALVNSLTQKKNTYISGIQSNQ